MDRIEEVKKILEKSAMTYNQYHVIFKGAFTKVATRINQLYESKPDPSGLLTDEETRLLYDQMAPTNQPETLALYSIPYSAVLGWSKITNKAQRDLTASIYQQEIEALIEAYEDMLDGMGKNSIDHFKVSDWNYVQSLKAKYTSKKE